MINRISSHYGSSSRFGGRKFRFIPLNDFTYTLIPNDDLTFTLIPGDDFNINLLPNNDLSTLLIPDNDIYFTLLPNNDILYSIIPNNDGTYVLIPNNDIRYSLLYPTPTPTPTSTPALEFYVINCGTSHVYNQEPNTTWNGYGGNYLQVGISQEGDGTIPPQAGWYFVDDVGSVRQLLNDPLWFSQGNPSPYPNGTGWLCVSNGPFALSPNNSTITFCESQPIVIFGPTPTPTLTPTETPTPTPTETPTPTPSPTEIEFNFVVYYDCVNGGRVITSGYTGGSGLYDKTFGVFSTENEALNSADWTQIANPNAVHGYQTNTSGTFWVAVRDRNNPSNKLAKSITVDCNTPTPTPTPTATPTPTPTATPTPTPTPTPTATPNSTFKSWTITQCGDSCDETGGSICACNNPSTITVYTSPSVSNLITSGVTIYTDSSLTTTWTGDYYEPSSDEVWRFTNGVSDFRFSCAIGLDSCIPAPTLVSSGLVIQLEADNSSSYSGTGTTVVNLRNPGTYNHTLTNATYTVLNGIKCFDCTSGTNRVVVNGTGPTLPTSGYTYITWARLEPGNLASFRTLLYTNSPKYTPITIPNGTNTLGYWDSAFRSSGHNLLSSVGTWVQYAVVGDSSSQTFYINGSQVGSSISFGSGGTTHWGWGNNDTAGQPWGYVANLYLYNRRLSLGEIQQQYNFLSPRFVE